MVRFDSILFPETRIEKHKNITFCSTCSLWKEEKMSKKWITNSNVFWSCIPLVILDQKLYIYIYILIELHLGLQQSYFVHQCVIIIGQV